MSEASDLLTVAGGFGVLAAMVGLFVRAMLHTGSGYQHVIASMRTQIADLQADNLDLRQRLAECESR